MNDKLKLAVEFFDNEDFRGKEFFEEAEKHSQIVLDLAKRYCELKGFPEVINKGTSPYCTHNDYGKCDRCEGLEKGIELSKLALLKKMDGIDKIIEGIETKHNGYFPITELAQAIKDHLTK